jgi:TRAP-type mannitol/chloroaromatic compound transport system permease small subunit
VKQCVYLIDSLTERLGRLLAWLIPLMMLGTTSVVVMRYGFGQGMTALQESVSYLHGIVFMLGAAYTLKHGGHVRVDIFYRRFSPRTKAWVDSIGSIVFLLPLCGLILITSWDFTLNAWAIHETSVEPGGLPFVYLLKTLLPLMAINLAMQGFAELLRNAMVLMGSEANVHAD